jgi:hypothetical protein
MWFSLVFPAAGDDGIVEDLERLDPASHMNLGGWLLRHSVYWAPWQRPPLTPYGMAPAGPCISAISPTFPPTFPCICFAVVLPRRCRSIIAGCQYTTSAGIRISTSSEALPAQPLYSTSISLPLSLVVPIHLGNTTLDDHHQLACPFCSNSENLDAYSGRSQSACRGDILLILFLRANWFYSSILLVQPGSTTRPNT